MSISAIMIDSREPTWIKELSFGGIPTAVEFLETGDLWAVTDDGYTIMVERKTPDDFLNSLKDDRLLPQLTKLSERRHIQQESGQALTFFPYLVITDMFYRSSNGHVNTQERGDTNWNWNSVQGILLSIQEMGVFVVFCTGSSDYESCIRRLGERDRKTVMNILPSRQPLQIGQQANFIMGLPGIGAERIVPIMEWCNYRPLDALMGLSDLRLPCPIPGIGEKTRKNIRSFLNLADGLNIEVIED